MKNKLTKPLILIFGIIAYSFLYIATKKTSLPCEEKGYTRQKDSIIYSELKKQKGYSYHTMRGKNCDSLEVGVIDSVFNYAVLGDSACVAAKKAQIIVKGIILVRWNSQAGRLDTFAIRPCQ